MTKTKCKNNNGYIERYYKKILTWDDRDRILDSLKKNKMCKYLYAPKEDIYHRRKWRQPYDPKWKKKFNLFCKNARSKKIDILFGVSPGLDFNFNKTI